MQLVLSGPKAIFLAIWTGRNLEEKPLTDFHDTVHVSGIGISAADHIIGVVGLTCQNERCKNVIYLLDPATGGYQQVLEEGDRIPSFLTIAIAPKRESLAFTSATPESTRRELSLSGPPGSHNDVYIYDLTNRQTRLVLRARAHINLSWTPDAEQLTYDTWEGWIQSVNLKTGRIDRLFKGVMPAWSPDGKSLAYHEGKTIYLYEPALPASKAVHEYHYWIRHFIGPLYWSPNGRYLSFNTGWDLVGLHSLTCEVIEVNSGKTFSFGTGGLQCGPWLAGK